MPGQVYYIDTNIGAPARLNDTVAAIVKVLKPGDSVLFRSGVYTNATYGDGNIWKDGQDIVLRINGAKGAPDAPITFAAAPGSGPLPEVGHWLHARTLRSGIRCS